jgi:hypothetical protein
MTASHQLTKLIWWTLFMHILQAACNSRRISQHSYWPGISRKIHQNSYFVVMFSQIYVREIQLLICKLMLHNLSEGHKPLAHRLAQ